MAWSAVKYSHWRAQVKWVWHSRNKAQAVLVQTVVCMLINSHDLFSEVAVRKKCEVWRGWWEANTGLYQCPQRRGGFVLTKAKRERCANVLNIRNILLNLDMQSFQRSCRSSVIFFFLFLTFLWTPLSGFASADSPLRTDGSVNWPAIHF